MGNNVALNERKAEYIKQARVYFEAGDIANGQKYTDLAKQAATAIEGIKSLEGMGDVEAPSMRPPLPGTQQTADDSFAQKASNIHTMRFGQPEDAVKGILRDLHGDGYEGAYLKQRSAFRNYLRRGDKHLSQEDVGLLKQIVMTPTAVKSLIEQGIDSVEAVKATMVEAIDTLGGFAVPVDFQMRVIERIQGLTVVRPKASVDNTSRDVVEIPVSTGGDDQYSSAVRVTWVDETPVAGVAATNLTFGMEQIPIHTVMAETGLSRNLIEDSAFNIENFLTKKFAESLAIDEDNRFLTGTGVGTVQGILPGGLNALSLTEKISGSAAALTWDGLLALMYAVPSQYRQNCVWIGERATYLEIAKLRNATSNDYLWKPWQYDGGADGAPAKLLGFPVLEQESMPSVAANAFPLVFGDLSGYQIFDRIGMTVERYLDSSTARQNMVMYVMRRRIGAQVVEPWRFAAQKVAAP